MNYSECARWLNDRDNFIIVTHVRPDGDTLGSAAALCSALRRAGKFAAMLPNPDTTPKYHELINEYVSNNFKYDYAISVDVAEEHMLCNGFDGKVHLSIDHHPTNPHYADELLLHAEKASCGESVLEVIKCLCGNVTPEEASLLYMALSTDCGGFRYANVTHETFAAASELAKYGAEIRDINYKFFRQTSRARMVLEGMICANLRFYKDGRLVAAVVTNEMMKRAGATENDCDDLAGIPGKAEGGIVSVLVRELEDGKCKVSVRSHPSFDSSAVCMRFGGGGHKMAAGCTIHTSPDEAAEMITSAICEVL
ncbi:MAG: bifunctional oligoribonuclease/PAP phosphatase NrnA [Oscillospiraceae bacterium]|nr:bifunctional oligoribonuclease/PAP phosphatase NrnA [Oscillospiraceae bacterium]